MLCNDIFHLVIFFLPIADPKNLSWFNGLFTQSVSVGGNTDAYAGLVAKPIEDADKVLLLTLMLMLYVNRPVNV